MIVPSYFLYSLLIVSFMLLGGCSAALVARPSTAMQPYCQGTGSYVKLRCQLARSQKEKNQAEVDRLSNQMTKLLGNRAGVPEISERFMAVSPNSTRLTDAQLPTAFNPYAIRIKRDAWWLQQTQPTELKSPLRTIASVITGTLAARRAGSEYPDQLLAMAKSAGDYLIWAQAQGRGGVFPLPDLRGESGRIPELIESFLVQAEASQRLSQVLVNGWIIDDLGGGDLQFDNGVCGVALLDLYRATGERRYLEAARKSADWAIAQSVVPNWNYNSFSVFLLASAYQITGESRYLDSAKEKARLGIYPGQLRQGSRKGWWNDPHNARLAYHYTIIRGLGTLVAALPDNDPDLKKARETLALALRAANSEIVAKGIAAPDYVLEVLSRLKLLFPAASERLADEERTQMLNLIGRYSSEIFLKGKLPVSPGAWGLYLEALASP